MVAPSGQQLTVSGGGYRAVITECGAGLRELEYDGQAIVGGYDESQHASGGRGQLLIPWPNRIRDGAYTFQGADLQLPLSEPSRGNASHGLVRWTAWTVREHTAAAARLSYRLMAQPGYPWTLDLEVTHEVSETGLAVRVSATNRSDRPAPYAFGAHPYLTVGNEGVDDWQLTVPAATRLVSDDRKIPTSTVPVADSDFDFRTPRRLGALALDDAFTDLARDEDGCTTVRLTASTTARVVELWMDGSHRWIQVYTGDDLAPDRARRSIAVEPMTAPANAFASGDGLIVLGRAGSENDTATSSWGVRAR